MIYSARDHPSNYYVKTTKQGGMILMTTVCQNELYHHGILGMKWGIRRYQNPDGSLTAAGRRRYGTVENLERKTTKNAAEAHEKAKQTAIKSGKVDEVRKYSSELTDEEMAVALKRIRDEQTLDSLKANEISIGARKVETINKTMGNISTAGESFKKMYNTIAQINNAFNKDTKMPVIGEKNTESIEDKSKKLSLNKAKYNYEIEKANNERQKKLNEDISKHTNKDGTLDLDYFTKNSARYTNEELSFILDRNDLAQGKRPPKKK